VWSDESHPMVRRTIVLPSSGSKNKPNKKVALCIMHRLVYDGQDFEAFDYKMAHVSECLKISNRKITSQIL
jgi:hypothetical protein